MRCHCFLKYTLESTEANLFKHNQEKGNKSKYKLTSSRIKILIVNRQIRRSLVVRIPGSHPGGPGSIPGAGS